MIKQHATAFSILVGFALVAAAIFFSNGTLGQSKAAAPDVSRSEHRAVYGNEDAPVTIVEFSDFECPFCARVHVTLKQIVDESEGEIAWEYRHLPIPSHKSAELAALISECVLRTEGNDKFWEYADLIFQNQSLINSEYLLTEAVKLGLSEEDLNACAANPNLAAQIEADVATARSLGGNSTPYNIIVRADGEITPVRGALPIEQWRTLLDN